VVGVKDRQTKKVRAKVVDGTDAGTLPSFVRRNVRQGSTVYTDEPRATRACGLTTSMTVLPTELGST